MLFQIKKPRGIGCVQVHVVIPPGCAARRRSGGPLIGALGKGSRPCRGPLRSCYKHSKFDLPMSSGEKTLKNIGFGLAAILVLIGLNYWSGQWLKGSVLSIFKKPLGVGYSFLNNSQLRVTSWFKTGRLLKENEALKSENRALVSTRLKISELEKENDFLRKELGVTERKNWEVVLARVFHQQINNQTNTALVRAGANEGVKAGRPVVFDGEVLYGLVKEAYADSALIYLITDPRVNLNVKIDETEISGKTRGALDGGLLLELVANQEKVEPGQLVVTSGLDDLPPALVVGKIKTAQTDRGGLFQKIEIEPEFKNLFIDRIFVIK